MSVESKDMQEVTREMAKQFLNLWEKQLEATLRDPEILQHTLKAMQRAQQQIFSQGMKQYDTPESATDDDLSPDGDDELLEFDRRLRAMEERISKLEAVFYRGESGA